MSPEFPPPHERDLGSSADNWDLIFQQDAKNRIQLRQGSYLSLSVYKSILGFDEHEAITPDGLKSAQRRLLKEFHPDTKIGKPWHEQQMATAISQLVNEAVTVLNDPELVRQLSAYAQPRTARRDASATPGWSPQPTSKSSPRSERSSSHERPDPNNTEQRQRAAFERIQKGVQAVLSESSWFEAVKKGKGVIEEAVILAHEYEVDFSRQDLAQPLLGLRSVLLALTERNVSVVLPQRYDPARFWQVRQQFNQLIHQEPYPLRLGAELLFQEALKMLDHFESLSWLSEVQKVLSNQADIKESFEDSMRRIELLVKARPNNGELVKSHKTIMESYLSIRNSALTAWDDFLSHEAYPAQGEAMTEDQVTLELSHQASQARRDFFAKIKDNTLLNTLFQGCQVEFSVPTTSSPGRTQYKTFILNDYLADLLHLQVWTEMKDLAITREKMYETQKEKQNKTKRSFFSWNKR